MDFRLDGFSTLSLHADDEQSHELGSDVAPTLHPTSTYRYPNDPSRLRTQQSVNNARDEGKPVAEDDFYIYSRLGNPNLSRAEALVNQVSAFALPRDEDGLRPESPYHSVLYNSGLSAFYGLLVQVNPKRIALGKTYHGCRAIAASFKKLTNLQVISLEQVDEKITKGDLIHIESPTNPTGLSVDIAHYVKIAHARGAFVSVDSTFAPPPLADPFQLNVDVVMHSATKYFGGHSDLLAGLVITKDPKVAQELKYNRQYAGTIPGHLENWLLLRSIRTLELRVLKQSETAGKIVDWLEENKSQLPAIKTIYNSKILQKNEDFILNQYTNYPKYGTPVFSIALQSIEQAKAFVSSPKLSIFQHATSLGGVESLVEWRAMSDPNEILTLIRFSIGLEDFHDLIRDIKVNLKLVENI